jgi:betaine-aldehyde dehydrogenase
VVLKPSDTTPVSTLLLAEIAAEFLPPGVLNVVCGDRDTGRALVAHPTPQMVSITGSVRAGMEVAAAAAADLKRTHLELGGKAPVVVFDDADVEAAAEAIAVAGYFNAGQDCTAATRVLAGARHARRLRRRAGRAGPAPRPGCPTTRTSSTARSTTRNQLDRVSGFVDRLPDHAVGRRRRARGSATAATSTSPPSSPACGRTTR